MKTPPPEVLADPVAAFVWLATYAHTVWVGVAGITALVLVTVVALVRES